MNTATTRSGSLFLRDLASARKLWVYGAAVILPVLTLLLRLALWRYLPGYPFLAFVPSVAFVALMGGVAPGVLTAALSALLGLTYLAEQPQFVSESQLLWTGLILYVIVCAILIALTQQTAKATRDRPAKR